MHKNIIGRLTQIEKEVKIEEEPICLIMSNPGETEEELMERVEALHDDNIRRCGYTGVIVIFSQDD